MDQVAAGTQAQPTKQPTSAIQQLTPAGPRQPVEAAGGTATTHRSIIQPCQQVRATSTTRLRCCGCSSSGGSSTGGCGGAVAHSRHAHRCCVIVPLYAREQVAQGAVQLE